MKLFLLFLFVASSTSQSHDGPMAKFFKHKKTRNEEDCISTTTSGSEYLELTGRLSVTDLGGQECSDVWGYETSLHKYAITGCSGGSGTIKFVRLTDGDGGMTIVGQFTNVQSIWYDFRTYQHYAFVISESTSGDSELPLLIFDMSQIDQGIVTKVIKQGFETTTNRNTHNIAIDTERGYLYRCNADFGFSGGIYVYDLNTNIEESTWSLVTEINGECHDIHVDTINNVNYIFVSKGYQGSIYIYNVDNIVNPILVSTVSYPSASYTHQLTVDSTKKYMYVNDELYRQNDYSLTSRVFIFNIENIETPYYINFYSNGQLATTHNMFAVGNYMFQANYVSGLRVYDITDRENIYEYSHYDTYIPQPSGLGFFGMWGTYPFSDNTIISSDINCGLYKFKFTPEQTCEEILEEYDSHDCCTIYEDLCQNIKDTYQEKGCCP